MAKDYVMLKIDVERHKNGAEVALRLRGTEEGGIPWIAITDAKGEILTTGDRPTDQGPSNIGCPATQEEQDWFMTMIGTTQQHMSNGQLNTLKMNLAVYAKSISR